MKIYRFRNCLLNTFERRVIRDGQHLDLTSRTFDVLQLLVEKAGEIVTKDELLGKVWNGEFVEEGNLPVHILKLRRSLGETKAERFIETAQGSGYRFVSSVSMVGENEWPEKMSGNGHARHPFSISPPTLNRESHKYYLKGKYLAEKRTEKEIYKAIACFEKAIAHDPRNVQAYVETVECYVILYVFDRISHTEVSETITPLLLRISTLDQEIDVVQAMLGAVKLYLEWDYVAAEKALQRALRINPQCLIARNRYIECLIISGRLSEALVESEEYLRIDAFSVLTYKRIGRIFWKTGQIERAISFVEDALGIEPSDYEALLILGTLLAEIGRFDEALNTLEKSISLHENDETLSTIGCIYAKAGRKPEAFQILERLKSSSSPSFLHLARLSFALNQTELAYAFLEKGFDSHEVDLATLHVDPRLDPIKHEARFRELISRIGILPAITI